MSIGDKIKELRLEKGLSLKQLAKEINVTDIAISRWERQLRLPNIENLTNLATFFGVSTDYLVGLED